MGLYMPAKKLQMVHEDLNHIILRPGELHIQMAHLKTFGSYKEGSGIDQAWIEADLYSPTTVKQIIEGNHVKRAETAHIITLQALFTLYQDAFLSVQEGNSLVKAIMFCSENTNAQSLDGHISTSVFTVLQV